MRGAYERIIVQKALFVNGSHHHANLVQVGVQQNMGLGIGVAKGGHHTAQRINLHFRQKGQLLPGHFRRAVLPARSARGAAQPEQHFL